VKPLYIFDLDGTLALCDHRRHYLDDVKDPQRWRRFFAACDRDEPNAPVIATLERLRHAGADVWIFSGRSDEVADKTVDWLAQHTSFMSWELSPESKPFLRMRAAGDHSPDDELKERWFNAMLVDDRQRLVGVFDDRRRVVDMWRRNGVTCFQVAEGEF